MNLNFKLGRLSRRTLLSMSRAIAPVELGVKNLDEEIVNHIEHQLRRFPRIHRFGFLLGLQFVEWCAPLGGWGVIPLSFLSREQATRRLYKLLHSQCTPVRLLLNGLRVLICLSAYGNAEVEEYFGVERRRWRSQRIKTRQALLARDGLLDEISGISQHQVIDHLDLPPVPETLYTPGDEEQIALLGWDAHERILEETTQYSAISPILIKDYVEDAHQDEEQQVTCNVVNKGETAEIFNRVQEGLDGSDHGGLDTQESQEIEYV